MAKILLTGAAGQVGKELEIALLKRGHKVVSCPHSALDVSSADRVLSAVLDSKAEAVINAAAYTNVEKAESEAAVAYSVNALGPRYLAQACKQANIPLVHISTDYVFSDDKGQEHKVDDPTNTECTYGKTKLEGESYIQMSGCKYLIVRTSWVFGRFGRNFVKIMLSMGQDRNEIAVVCDQLGNPTPARPLAEALVLMTEQAMQPDFKDFGVYHFCGYDATTWADFAGAIFNLAYQMKVLNHQVAVLPITSKDFKSKVKRPHDSRLNCDKTVQVFHVQLPNWSSYLGEVVNAYVRECQGLAVV